MSGRASSLWKLSNEVLTSLSDWNDVQMICTWPRLHGHPIISCFIKLQNGLPFWCRLTQGCREKRLLNGMDVSLIREAKNWLCGITCSCFIIIAGREPACVVDSQVHAPHEWLGGNEETNEEQNWESRGRQCQPYHSVGRWEKVKAAMLFIVALSDWSMGDWVLGRLNCHMKSRIKST